MRYLFASGYWLKAFPLVVILSSCSSRENSRVEQVKLRAQIKAVSTGTVSQGNVCTKDADCVSGLICDYYSLNYLLNGSKATCQPSCDPSAHNSCVSGNVCNPLTRTCQTFCNGAPGNTCASAGIAGNNPQCSTTSTSSQGYCFAACTQNGDCTGSAGGFPSGTVCNRGVCVAPCSAGCSGPGQTCDQTTGGCGVACSAGGTECGSVTLPPLVGTGTLAPSLTGCSIYSATCAPTTTITAPTAICSPVTENGLTLCEQTCTQGQHLCGSNGGCLSYPGAHEAQYICQIPCTISQTNQCSIFGQSCQYTVQGNTTTSCQYLPATPNNCQGKHEVKSHGYCLVPNCNPACTGNQLCQLNSAQTAFECMCDNNQCANIDPTKPQCSADGSSCVCSGSSCHHGDTCGTGGQCVCDSSTCTSAGGTCSDNKCVFSGCSPACSSTQKCQSVDGAQKCVCDPSKCPATQQICSSSGTCSCTETSCGTGMTCGSGGTCICSAKSCDSIGGICSADKTSCNKCGTTYCGPQESCISGSCHKAQCGNGMVEPGEQCDDGPKNGQAGYCNNNCSSPCAFYVTTQNKAPMSMKRFSKIGDAQTALVTNPASGGVTFNAGTTTDGSNVCGASQINTGMVPQSATTTAEPTDQTNDTQAYAQYCPCGYGIWVENNISTSGTLTPYSEGFPIKIKNNMVIYGGFSHDQSQTLENQRRSSALLGVNLMDRNYPSGTVWDGGSKPILVIDSAATNVLIDGFQIQNGQSQIANQYCSDSKIQGGGAVTICSGATVTLNNMRFTNNQASGLNGGAIRNQGILTVTNTGFFQNQALNQGGAISSEGTKASLTVKDSVFFGNGFSDVPPQEAGLLSCAVGGTCFGVTMTCPTGGGSCTGCNNQNSSCPTGYLCQKSDGTCIVIKSFGGAIASTGGGSLVLKRNRFISNYSYGNGGAVYTDHGMTLNYSLFTGNWASNAGGAIYISKNPGARSTLDHLTLIENKAYNQGGGAIYDEGVSGSTISNAYFLNNHGLYPANTSEKPVSNASMAEWIGDRSSDGDINSIFGGATVSGTTVTSQTSTLFTSATGAGSNVQMCPNGAYSPYSSNLVCSGTDVCGSIVGQTNSPYMADTNSTKDAYGNYVCPIATKEFGSTCKNPIYQNCSKVQYFCVTKTKTGEVDCSPSAGQNQIASRQFLLTNSVTNNFQARDGWNNPVKSTCTESVCSACDDDSACLNLFPVAPVCGFVKTLNTKSCRECFFNSDCVGNQHGDVCLNHQCVFCGSNGVECPPTNVCASNADCLELSQDRVVCYNNQCVQCTIDSDCKLFYPGGPQHCDSSTNTCVECLGAEDCSSVPGTDTCVNGVCTCAGNGYQKCDDASPTCTQSTGCTCGGGQCLGGQTCSVVSTDINSSGYACTCGTQGSFGGQADSSLCPKGQTCVMNNTTPQCEDIPCATKPYPENCKCNSSGDCANNSCIGGYCEPKTAGSTCGTYSGCQKSCKGFKGKAYCGCSSNGDCPVGTSCSLAEGICF